MKLKFIKILINSLIVFVLLPYANGQRSGYGSISEQDYLYAFSEATRHYLFGNYVQAVTLYKECLRIKPQSGAVHFQLSKVYLGAGNVPLAREHAKKASNLTPENKWYIQQLGDIYQMEQKLDSAVLTYKKLLIIEPGQVNVILGIASIDQKIGKYDEALLYLDSIDYQVGISKEVLLERYKIYDLQNKGEEAIGLLKSADKLDESDYSVPGMLAEYYRRHNLQDSAWVYYNEIYPEFADQPVVVFSYADFLMENGQIDSTRSVLLKAMADTGMDMMSKASFFYSILQEENQLLKARPILDTVAEAFYMAHNRDLRTASIYSDVQIRLRNFRKAADALKRITEKDPANYAAMEQLVFALNVMGKTDSVLLYSGRAIQQFKDRPLLYLFNGSAQYQKGAWENAVNSLNNGLALTDDESLQLEFYSLLAECYQNLKKFDESEAAFRNALKIDKDNIPIKNNYAYYLSLREKDLKIAEKLSLETIRAEPDNATYLDTYAWILFKKGKFRKAEKFILSAIKNGGKDEDILKHCAEIQIKLGKYAEAVKYLNEVLRMEGVKDKATIIEQIRDIEARKGQQQFTR